MNKVCISTFIMKDEKTLQAHTVSVVALVSSSFKCHAFKKVLILYKWAHYFNYNNLYLKAERTWVFHVNYITIIDNDCP